MAILFKYSSVDVYWIVREFGMEMCPLLYLKWVTNKVLLCNTGNSAQCYVAAWMGGEFGGEWVHVYVRSELLCCAPETVTASSLGFTPM